MEELPEGIEVDIAPDPAGIESLTRQIRQTGRAYPLFDIGHLILKRPDRYWLEFRALGKLADGTPRQFHVCNLDDTVWLSEGDAVRHVLTKHFEAFYQTDRIAVDPPKGTYTFVAQCGISGVILGPPNLHDYQAKLQRLHSERFSRMPFDMFKSRIRIVRDEAVVKQWVEQQSFKNEFTCLNVPEPLKLASREAVEKHFREVHLANIVHPAPNHVVKTPAGREALPPPLRRLARREFDLQQRFPLKLVTRLSDEFAHRGLHFFKVNKTVLHVAVARPRFLDLETNPVGEGIRRILGAIESTPDCTRRKLLEKLGVALPASAPAASAPAPTATAPAPAPAAGEGEAPPAEAAAPVAPVAAPEPSPELQALVTDLHWLIHEGHVIEFANGRIEAAKKPAPRPQPVPRPPKAPRPPQPGAPSAAAPAPEATAPVANEGSAIETVEGSVSDAVAETAPAPVEPPADATAPDAGTVTSEDDSKINPS
ncbi:MAG: hypothetical protein IT580_06210 [Verrucomicrobiales bacterium]|nr:hypothetical protein [Verrucomicrobiales bacterium]